jgi:hypothetical protein
MVPLLLALGIDNLGSGLFLPLTLVCLATVVLPAGWRTAWLLGISVVLAVGGLLFGARVNALAVDLAPPSTRGRHLAVFQYAFTVPQVVAPAVVALFAAGMWVPWVVVATCAGAGAFAFRWFGSWSLRAERRQASGAPQER